MTALRALWLRARAWVLGALIRTAPLTHTTAALPRPYLPRNRSERRART